MAKFALKGLHQVRKVNSDGSETWHVYAWRGGPKIASAPRKVFAADDALISAFQAAHSAPIKSKPVTHATLETLVEGWRCSAEFRSLKPGTRRDYEIQIAKIEAGSWANPASRKVARLAALTIRELEDKRVRSAILSWRDENFAATPRAADKVIGALSACLTWAVDRGKLNVNNLLGTTKLHKASRADVIWTDEDLEKVRPHCSPDLWRAVRLALFTGLSIADLARLPWSAFDGGAIEGHRAKTGRPFLIPALPTLKALLGEMPRRSPIILTNAYGKPWSLSGLSHAFGEARDKAGLGGKLVFHDLRGTAATRFIASGLSYAQAGAVLGWDEKRVEAIARRYVDRKTVVAAMLDRMSPASGNT
ncbi:MAG: tyrosine-type recombinase/integrase [Vitreimonas sp.]